MTTPQGTLWKIKPHTRAKHEILRRYLGAWFRILASSFSKLVYVDGFCGPGRYQGGEAGSPLVAIEAAQGLPEGVQAELHFTDWDRQRLHHLTLELRSQKPPPNVAIKCERAHFDGYLRSLLDHLATTRMPPMFVFVDPFGFSKVPYALLKRLLSYRSTEVLITFSADAVNRFLGHPNEKIRALIIDLFGTKRVLEIVDSAASDRIVALRDLYQQQLLEAARFVRFFEMRDERDRVVYYLFFASNNHLGHKRMKEAMWKVDPDGEFRFSDATDVDQPVLFTMDVTAIVSKSIMNRFRQAGQVSVKEVIEFIVNDTPFIDKHVRPALRKLEGDGDVRVNPLKASGKPRRTGTFPPDAVIRFPGSKSDNHG
ncbi:MAG: three-Cys-motif partner protein TcmP [Armatimonadota bacterium]